MARPFTTNLTDRQQQVLDWVRSFAQEHGMPPTYREIGDAFKINVGAAFDFIKALERKGYIRRSSHSARCISFSGVPIETGDQNCCVLPMLGTIGDGGKVVLAPGVDKNALTAWAGGKR